jgi:hypothetical protein
MKSNQTDQDPGDSTNSRSEVQTLPDNQTKKGSSNLKSRESVEEAAQVSFQNCFGVVHQLTSHGEESMQQVDIS